MSRELEVCAETLQACEAAQAGGADRIELCAALSEGGVTPGPGFMREAITAVRIPMHVLVRPRSGNFVYGPEEFRMCCADAEAALASGAAGIVVGVLTAGGDLHTEQLRTLLRIAGDRPLTFHRAFDRAQDLAETLAALIDLGCSRVLTSGGLPTVTEGRDMLARLAAQAAGRIRIAAGGGVTLTNARLFTAVPGLDLHASLRQKPPARAGDVLWNDGDTSVRVDDVRTLAEIVHADA
jgi:copper homeostasis protein